MGDVVIVVCGGAAHNIADGFDDLKNTPQVMLSNKEATVDWEDPEAIKKAIHNYRIVIPFCVLGGELGTEVVRTVIRCARECDCKVVSVMGMPMEIEKERRARAVAHLPDITSISDVSLVFDLTRAMNVFDDIRDRRWFDFLTMTNRLVMKSVKSIRDLMEGPFFTTFSERVYAFSSSNDVLPTKAVEKAWNMMLFDNDTEKNSCVVLVSSRTSTAEMEAIQNKMVMDHGIMPDVIRRLDDDDSKVIVFKAISSF